MTDRIVAGRYRLGSRIGVGGMGRVWHAYDEVLRREVAVKEVMLPETPSENEAYELSMRTLREAQAAARLSHPNVVRVYDVMYADDRPWIVMEYIPSRSLAQVIKTEGPLRPEQVARVGIAVLDALCAAHAAGVLHRDIKPGNVLLAEDGRVVLTDFGLATFEEIGIALTQSGIVHGSPQFIAPERALDGTSSVEADMWSLGATLYAAVEGQSPYARPTSYQTLAALATSPPDPPKQAGALKP
ncbi:MAG TPA: serine/threonine-protein kinase, partial [Micromonosporaceae bacterium]|nr:serine/threonine-protein kinase [Micromonosporaceae bacterium]